MPLVSTGPCSFRCWLNPTAKPGKSTASLTCTNRAWHLKSSGLVITDIPPGTLPAIPVSPGARWTNNRACFWRWIWEHKNSQMVANKILIDKIHMKKPVLLLLASALLAVTDDLPAQGTAFTYQGRLQNAGTPATGSYDFTFSLFNTNGAGSVQVGDTLTNLEVGVTDGLFTVALDFGPVWTGNPRGWPLGCGPMATRVSSRWLRCKRSPRRPTPSTAKTRPP